MLKSFSTQLAATAFFGPVGLAYTSMATAVLYTLILAVLYFTGFGVLAILVTWPISIVTGVLYVKFHNDRMRQSGNRLLLGPGDQNGLVSTVGSWARGVAVLGLICGIGFGAYKFLPDGDEATAPGLITDASIPPVGEQPAAVENVIVGGQNSEDVVVSERSDVPVITLPNRNIPRVIVDSSGKSTTTISGESGVGDNTVATQPVLFVDREVVNLRQGPGTRFAIVTQLDRNERIFEFARDGEWINIETENGNHAGWIHGNLVRR